MHVSRADAAREVMARRSIRRSLIGWGRYKCYEAAAHHRLICEQIEDFLAGDDDLERMQRERKAYVYRSEFPTRGDKGIRAQSIRGRMALDGLYVPQSAAWLSDLRHEL